MNGQIGSSSIINTISTNIGGKYVWLYVTYSLKFSVVIIEPPTGSWYIQRQDLSLFSVCFAGINEELWVELPLAMIW